MKRIELTQGKFAIVDDDNFEELSQFNWYANRKKDNNYFAQRKAIVEGNTKILLMHRVIMGCPDDLQIDHINHDTLDNRKENLRVCSNSSNQMNKRKKRKIASSKYKGVTFCKDGWRIKKWKAYLQFGNKRYSLGYFLTEEEAARAYDNKAKELFGEFVYLNFPDEA